MYNLPEHFFPDKDHILDQPLQTKRKIDSQNDHLQEAKKQQLSHDIDTLTIDEFSSTRSLIPTDTTVTGESPIPQWATPKIPLTTPCKH